MIRAIIIDDETTAREALKQMLLRTKIKVEIVAEADSVEEGFRCIKEKNPSVVFLDYVLKDGTGIDLLEKASKHNLNVRVIFISAFEEPAAKAFKYKTLHYLTKPISVKDLKVALERVENGLPHTMLNGKETETELTKETPSASVNDRVKIKHHGETHFIDPNLIILCLADKTKTTIFMVNDEEMVSNYNLGELESMLSGRSFIRTHRSYLVNKNYISKLKTTESVIQLTNGKEVPVSTRKLKQLKDDQ